jgi:MoaA/NifB/PqqE/SkfB family radical SAM enzyme
VKEKLSIEVKITDHCNQECFHCANRDGLRLGHNLPWKVFNRKLEEWAQNQEGSVYSLKEIRLTGGEPLVNFEAVLEMAKCCQRLGIRSGINTNGLLLDSTRIQLLKEAGVDVMKVSFDSINKAIYCQMRGFLSSLRPFFNGIKTLVKNRFKVILRFTLSRINRDQLVPCYSAAQDLGVYKFQIKPLIRAGRAMDSDFFLNKEEVNDALLRISHASTGTGLLTEILCWPPVKGIGFIYKICGSVDKIYVSPKLSTSICNYVPEASQVPMGNLARVSLADILRRRHDEVWTESVNGYCLIRGCPNSTYFESS